MNRVIDTHGLSYDAVRATTAGRIKLWGVAKKGSI